MKAFNHTEILKRPIGFGAKTRHLVELLKLGLSVPPFVAVPGDALGSLSVSDLLSPDSHEIIGLCEDVEASLSCLRYAVRSSALIEDQAENSFAGYFSSEVDVPPDGLRQALHRVLSQALNIDSNPARFSLLIQEYINADFAGVTFTRDPGGGRELVLEFVEGPCSALVSGLLNPERLRAFHDSLTRGAVDKRFSDVFSDFLAIEQHFGCPQDIEWCFGNGRWWFLQSRPISTISPEQFRGMKFLDEYFKGFPPRILERSSVCETSPRPSRATFDLLRRLYAAGGPVSRVYKTYGLCYQAKNFLELLNSDLYSDKEKEYQTLFPAYQLNAEGELRFRWSVTREAIQTVWNKIRLELLSGSGAEALGERLQKAFSARNWEKGVELEHGLGHFLEDYSLIFEINFLAGVAQRRLQSISQKLFPADSHVFFLLLSAVPPKSLEVGGREFPEKGNSLEFLDESPFMTSSRDGSPEDSERLEARLLSLQSWTRDHLLRLAGQASTLSALRERGRWLALLHVNRLRESIRRKAVAYAFNPPDDIFRFSFDQIFSGDFTEFPTQEGERMEFPLRVSNLIDRGLPLEESGVSAGIAEGTLLAAKDLEQYKGEEKPILYSEFLSPALAKYLENISGVVASHGGLLSHFAILARERKIPVITNVDSQKVGKFLRRKVRIDGWKGTLVFLEKSNDS